MFYCSAFSRSLLICSFNELGNLINKVYNNLVKNGTIVPGPEAAPPKIPIDFAWARKLGLIRKPASFVSTISDESKLNSVHCTIYSALIISMKNRRWRAHVCWYAHLQSLRRGNWYWRCDFSAVVPQKVAKLRVQVHWDGANDDGWPRSCCCWYTSFPRHNRNILFLDLEAGKRSTAINLTLS